MAITPAKRHWAKTERAAAARLNARRGGLLQRLSTALLTDFVGGLERRLWHEKTTAMAFSPRSMDSSAVDGIGFGLVLLVQ